MATINLRDNRQVIDYLARDYSSFRQALLNLIPAKLPEWTGPSEADFGVVLIELFAYMGDILSYYQDRLANEAFLGTAQERRSIINHLRLIGYEMAPAAPAAAKLSLILAAAVTQPVEIHKGDQFATVSSKERKSVTFEYVDEKPLVIDPTTAPSIPVRKPDGSTLVGFREFSLHPIPIVEGRTIVREVLGVSDGTPNQRFTSAQPRLLRDSLQIILETSPPTPPWRLRKDLIFSAPAFTPEQLAALQQQGAIGSTLAFSRSADADYAIETDENDVTTVVFGDGQYGQIPPSGVRILATYRVGGGTVGNVGAGQITVIANAPPLQLLGAKVINRAPASGGAERESIAHAVRSAPIAFTSMQRAVTREDYVAQAKLFPGVSKARAEAGNWNTVTLYIAPAGFGEPPSDVLKANLLAYFEDKRMLTSVIEIESPEYVEIEITADVTALPYFRNVEVQNAAQQAIQKLFDFGNVDFAEILYLSKIYEALETLDGVDHLFVSRFALHTAAPATPAIPSDGRIVLSENQIPVLRAEHFTLGVSGGQ